MSLVSTQKKENNIVELEIAVSAEELEAAAARAYRKQVKNITVPGFRKGKAPRTVIEKMYGADVFLQDAVEELYPSAYEAALVEADIIPVDRASVDMVSLDKATGFVFKATVTVKPEVKLGEYKGLSVEKIVRTADDTMIDAEIEKLRTRHARVSTVEDDTPAKDGDMVLVDFKGFIDGAAFEGGEGTDYQLKLGSHQFIDTFEDQIVGHKTGDEFEVNVTFPEEYHAEELKGKPAMFQVKLKEIQVRELPVVDDEFAKDASEFDTLAELKDDLRKKLQEDLDKQSTEEMENALIDQVIADMEVDIPACMIENKIDEMVQSFAQNMQSQGVSLDQYLQIVNVEMADFRDNFREQAERQVKTRLALEKIVEIEGIEADEEKYENELQKMADAYKIDIEKIRAMVQNYDIKADMRCNAAIDLITESAKITEKAEEKAEAEEKPVEKKKTTRKRTTKKKDAEAEAEAESDKE